MDLNHPEIVKLTEKAETFADQIIRRTRTTLPTIGRLLLTSTFIEDGIRMWLQWSQQRDYIAYHWNVYMFVGTMFVIFNLIAQLAGSAMVVVRKQVRIACAILLSVVIVQTFSYKILWSVNFFFKNLSLVGGLALLLSETFEVGRKSMFAGIPSLNDRSNHVNYMQLFGRTTLVFMFLTIQRWETSFLYLLETALACALMFLVTIGWKTKLSALALAGYLLFMNVWINAFWRFSSHSSDRDLYKYEFFQTLSVAGGLLLLISLGPGRVSVDQAKREM